jgi:hypothetical protein
MSATFFVAILSVQNPHRAGMKQTRYGFLPNAGSYAQSQPDWVGLHRHPICNCHFYMLNIIFYCALIK